MRSFLFALPAVLGACVSNGVQPLKPLEIVTLRYSPTVTSSATGSLAYERGCLQFYDESGKQMLSPVWPDGTIFNGTSVVFHKPGRADQPIVLNQEFVLSGQPLTWSAVPGPRATEFQRQCGGTPFVVADVAPAN
jgi:hypothetical protein